MNLDNYIDENLDEIIDNFDKDELSHSINENEDNNINDVLEDLYEKLYFDKNNTNNKNDNSCFNNLPDHLKTVFNVKDESPSVKIEQENDPNVKIEQENDPGIEQDDGYYFFNLINIFIKYYNEKYDKHENFFNNIKKSSDTSTQMEMFFESIFEFRMYKEDNKLSNEDAINNYYDYENKKEIKKLFENNNQIYALEYNEKKIITPSLLICLNYIYEKKIINEEWRIYNLNNK